MATVLKHPEIAGDAVVYTVDVGGVVIRIAGAALGAHHTLESVGTPHVHNVAMEAARLYDTRHRAAMLAMYETLDRLRRSVR